jgi:hypothetical protein
MLASQKLTRFTFLAVGIVFGTIIGSMTNAPVHAVATDRHENFALCTGPVSGSLEALYVLDFLTGELKGCVLNEQTGQFNAFYTRSILADFGVQVANNPKYIMVSGAAGIKSRGAGGMLGNRGAVSVVYVAELTTGKIAAYALPYAGTNGIAGGAVQSTFALLHVIPFRQVAIRPGGAGTKP